MKITPIASSAAGSPSTNVHGAEGTQSAGPDKIARAKAIAAGQDTSIRVLESDTPQERQPDFRRIVMKTNVSHNRPEDAGLAPAEPETPPAANNEVPPVIEDTKPLDPQFAALAKERRALQAKQRELSDKLKALEVQSASSANVETLAARLKSEPLSVLQEYGVTYDQLTQDILANQNNPELRKLQAEVKALKEEIPKALADKDAQAEKQVLSEIRREADSMSFSSDEFEMIRATRSQPEVVELIRRIYKETGEILDVSEAMQLVEDDLVTESLKLANTKKVKSRLTPSQANQVQPQLPSKQKQIRTLTNRDTAKPVQSRRDRAIAAALGNLKR
jgi:hypothetical protein